MPSEPPSEDEQDPEAQASGSLPTSLVPRWLALLVLLLLLGAAAFSIVSLLSAEPRRPAAPEQPALPVPAPQ